MPLARPICILLLAVLVAGCASTPDTHAIEPDLSLLKPARQALAHARRAHVKNFAPAALDAARRRVSLARDIIYMAARQGRGLNEAEYKRVTDLVHAARLDAKAAVVKTQALAAGTKLKQLRHGVPGGPVSKPRSIRQGAAS